MQIPGIFRVKNVRSQYIYIHIGRNIERPRHWGRCPRMLKRRYYRVFIFKAATDEGSSDVCYRYRRSPTLAAAQKRLDSGKSYREVNDPHVWVLAVPRIAIIQTDFRYMPNRKYLNNDTIYRVLQRKARKHAFL